MTTDITARERLVDDLLGAMTLEQKVGGCLIMDFMGTVAPPYVHRLVRDFHLAGLRVDTTIRGKPSYVDAAHDAMTRLKLARGNRAPAGVCRDFLSNLPAPFATPADYARTGNRLRQMALDRPLGIPIHLTLDQEGNGNENYTLGDVRLFPAQMGLAASGDASLVERVGWALAAQLRAAGLNWIHAPVLDVNTDPRNPEINTRAFSDDPAVVARYGLAILRGFQAHGLIATGKHFPGRGHSASDAHHGLPVIDLPLQDLLDLHIAPYRAMIAAGMPAIMTAHTIYPAFDRDEPATLSPAILTDYLRGELGFEGVVTSDNMTMGGIVVNYEVPDACIRALNAGVDLLLVRSESPLCEEIFVELLQAARDGRIPEDRLDEANARILRLKWDHGLFATGGMVDPALAADPEHDPAVLAVEREAAERATLVRNRGGLLPIGPDRRVLLVEQVHPTHELINNQGCHPSIFWEQLLEINAACMSVEIDGMSDVNRLRVLRRLDEADVVVMTNWVARRSDKDLTPFVREIVAAGKPVVVVTNSPFQFGSPDELDTVVNIFCTNPESLRAAAEIIYGRREAAGVLPVGRVR